MFDSIMEGKGDWSKGWREVHWADYVVMRQSTLDRVCEYFKDSLSIPPTSMLFGLWVQVNDYTTDGMAAFFDRGGNLVSVQQLYDPWDRVLDWREVARWGHTIEA